MRLGIFARTYKRATVEELFDAVRADGLRCVQFNMVCAGVESMPDVIPADLCHRIRNAADAREIELAAISGTFNVIHPDRQLRERGLQRLETLAAACPLLGTRLITLCTGTRDPQDMWRRHPENDSPAAWDDLLASVRRALEITSPHGVDLAFEPELANVVDSAVKGRRLLDQIGSPRLKVVIDAANLFPAGTLPRMRQIIEQAIDLLGDQIVLAHAKDLADDGHAGDRAAGTGVLDFAFYLGCLRRRGYGGPVILHGLTEPQVPAAIAHIARAMESGAEPK